MRRLTHKRITLLSPCGWGNLGDAAIVSAVIANIRSRDPDAIFYAVTSNPKDTERRHNVEAFPIAAKRYKYSGDHEGAFDQVQRDVSGASPGGRLKRRLKRAKWLRLFVRLVGDLDCLLANIVSELRHARTCYAIARESTLLIVAGGGQLDDYWGGAWGHPFTLLKWACMSRLAGTPIVVLSVGYGTCPSALSRLFLRGMLSLTAYRSFRDQRTGRYVRQLLGFPSAAVVPDLAFSLPVVRRQRTQAVSPQIVVGISPIAFADPRSWPEKDESLYRGYIERLAQFIGWLQSQGHKLLFFCTDNMDVHSLRDLQARVAAGSWLESDADRPAPYYKSVDELSEQLARTDVVVASRLHGVILAHRLGKPVVALSYDWKVDAHMEEFEESANCLNIGDFQAPDIAERFARLLAQREEIEAKIKRKVTECSSQTNEQFDLCVSGFLGQAG